MKTYICNEFPTCAFGTYSGYVEIKSLVLEPNARRQITIVEWNLEACPGNSGGGTLNNQHPVLIVLIKILKRGIEKAIRILKYSSIYQTCSGLLFLK